MQSYPVDNEQHIIKIGQAWLNADSEFTQWHIDHIFQDLCGNFVTWCDEQYSDRHKFFRHEQLDYDYGVKLKIQWFIEFQNLDAKTHYALTWHDSLFKA